MHHLNIAFLRRFALISLALVALVDLLLSLPSQGAVLGGAVLVVFPTAMALMGATLMPGAVSTLLRNLDLLAPLALMTVASKVIAWLTMAPLLGAVLSPSLPLRAFNISVGISLGGLLHLVVIVAYTTWATGAVVELVCTGNGDPCRVLPAMSRKLWRMLGLILINWAGILVASAAVLLMMPAIGFVALLAMFVLAVIWNFATAAVLPVAWTAESGVWQSFRAGVRTSLANAHKWGMLLISQMLLLGLIFIWYSHWTDSGGNHSNLSWSVNAFWTGGYEHDCRWYGKLADTMHLKTLPLVETLLTLLFGALAVAIKIAIVQRLSQEPSPAIVSYATT